MSTGPGAVSTSPGRIDLFAGCGVLCWWTFTDGTWTSRGPVGLLKVTSTPTIAASAPGTLEVLARNGHAVNVRTYDGAGWRFTRSLSAPGPADSSVGVAVGRRGQLVAYLRNDQSRLSGRTLAGS